MVILFKYILTLIIKQQSSSTKHQVENIHFIYGGHYEMCLLFRENRQKMVQWRSLYEIVANFVRKIIANFYDDRHKNRLVEQIKGLFIS